MSGFQRRTEAVKCQMHSDSTLVKRSKEVAQRRLSSWMQLEMSLTVIQALRMQRKKPGLTLAI